VDNGLNAEAPVRIFVMGGGSGELQLTTNFRPATDLATEATYGLYVFVALAWMYVGWWKKIQGVIPGWPP